MSRNHYFNNEIYQTFVQKIQETNYEDTWQRNLRKMPSSFSGRFSSPSLASHDHPFDENIFEWISILESVCSAKKKFTMFELGAGHGRWCVNAWAAIQLLNPIPCHFVGVEAEPTHFYHMKRYFSAHGLRKRDHRLINAAIDNRVRKVFFHIGNTKEWYGQNIDESKLTFRERLDAFKYQIICALKRIDPKRRKVVKTITLNSLLLNYDFVDLIDMDIQGKELDVIRDSVYLLNKKVKRVQIGTHSQEIDKGLEQIFKAEGWNCNVLLPSGSTCQTQYGVLNTQDGIQTWTNPLINYLQIK